MLNPTYLLFYVDSPAASGRFYGDLLNLRPVEEAPTFVLFALPSGLKLGLWSRHTVEPAATAAGGGGELAISVASPDEVDRLCDAWWQRGLVILQPPVDLDFGRTFVALDPDGHRLRVFALAEEVVAETPPAIPACQAALVAARRQAERPVVVTLPRRPYQAVAVDLRPLLPGLAPVTVSLPSCQPVLADA